MDPFFVLRSSLAVLLDLDPEGAESAVLALVVVEIAPDLREALREGWINLVLCFERHKLERIEAHHSRKVRYLSPNQPKKAE